jgi:hypothetical protein
LPSHPAEVSETLATSAGSLLQAFRRRAIEGAGVLVLGGLQVADLPVQAPSKYELMLDLKTAKTLKERPELPDALWRTSKASLMDDYRKCQTATATPAALMMRESAVVQRHVSTASNLA